ncbi:MAG: potassium channel family protein [Methanomassiliicoccales archaeon]
MKVVIVGGGRLGKQLADTLPDSSIVESNKGKVADLVNRFGPERVIYGTGVSENALERAGIEETDAVVVATNDDHTNYLISLLVEKYDVPKIVVRVDEPANVEIFKQIGIETIICPAVTAAKMINSALFPGTKEMREVSIMEDSPLKGKRIKDLSLPGDCMVTAILRGQHPVRPDEEMIIEKGDTLVICSPSGSSMESEPEVSGGEADLRPFHGILAVVRREDDVHKVMEECACLASSMDIRLTVAALSEELLDKCRDYIDEEIVFTRWKVLNNPKLEELSYSLKEEMPGVGVVILSMGKDEKKLFGASHVTRFLNGSKVPVLIPRGRCPYKNILTLMGCEDVCEESATMALKIAMVTGAELSVLNYRDPVDLEQARMMQLKRVGRMYDCSVMEEAVDGNPTLELVSKMSSGEFDMAVVNWNSRVLKKDVIKRMMFETNMSVLIYTK